MQNNSVRVDRTTLLSAAKLSAIFISIWILWAVFKTSEHYRLAAATSPVHAWQEVFLFQLSTAFLWAFWTPIIIGLSQWLSFRRAPVWHALLLMAGVPVMAIIRAVVGAMIYELNERGHITWDFIVLCIRIRLFQNVLFILAIFVMTRVVMAMREEMERKRRVAELERHIAVARLEELRARFPRSFLFGTLATIRTLIGRDTRAADDLIVAFGNVLRLAADSAHAEHIKLEDELYFADQYLRVRNSTSGKQIRFRFEADDDALAAMVRPMVLQPRIEDAIERGGAELSLTIRGQLIDGHVILTVEDSAADEALPLLEVPA
jgi:hypothetical protein